MQRIHSIDYLRGLMALAVLIYHFFSWSIGAPDSSSVLGRLGIYAVSIFYIVSGISLYLAYQNINWAGKELVFFVLKRYLRLVPAFWVACAMVLVLLSVTSPTFVVSNEKILSNFALTFGFTNPDQYLTTGGWSIGNEMVFYAFFPLVMIAPKFRTALISLSLLVTLVAYIHFSFNILSPVDYLGNQWSAYVAPLNQAFLFFLGVAIAWASIKYRLAGNKYSNLILCTSVLIFCLYPAAGNQINIVTGPERLVFTAACAACCIAVLNSNYNIRESYRKILYLSGCVSYTIYMFHGVFADVTLQLIAPKLGLTTPNEKLAILLLLTLPVLLVFAYAFYTYVEKPVMGLGRFLRRR